MLIAVYIPFHPKIYGMQVDYRVNAQDFLALSDCMHVDGHAYKYWGGILEITFLRRCFVQKSGK